MKATFLVLLGFTISLKAYGASPLEELLRKLDRLYSADGSFAKVSMKVENPHFTRELKLDIYSKGRDYALITIVSPAKDRGVRTLKRKNEMWNYFPKINKVFKVPPSLMMGSWMGSDFTNDDLVKEQSLLDDYIATEQKNPPPNTRLITLKPKDDAISLWGRIEIEIAKDLLLPRKQVFFDYKNNKARTLTFSEVKAFDGRKLPTILTLIPHQKSGHKTTLHYHSIDFKTQVSETLFSRRNLQKGR